MSDSNQVPTIPAFAEPMFKGVQFPLRSDGYLNFVVDEHAINSALYQLLMTEPGERVMELEFGVALRELLFEFNDNYMHTQVQQRVAEAIDTFEPRIVVREPGILVHADGETNENAEGGQHAVRISFKWTFKQDLMQNFSFDKLIVRTDRPLNPS